MEKLRATFAVSFRAKVLVPVIAVMVLLMAMTMYVVNYHITEQVEKNARDALAKAATGFRNLQAIRTRDLFLRFRSVRDEPKYRATFQTRDAGTISDQLARIMAAQEVDFVMFSPNNELTTDNDGPVLQKRDQLIPHNRFVAATTNVVAWAMSGDEKADTVQVGQKLYEAISVPVFVDKTLIGALTFGNESWKSIQELGVGNGPIALIAGDHVIVSSFSDANQNPQLVEMFRDLSAAAKGRAEFDVRQITLGTERFYLAGGRFDTLSPSEPAGFLLDRKSVV